MCTAFDWYCHHCRPIDELARNSYRQQRGQEATVCLANEEKNEPTAGVSENDWEICRCDSGVILLQTVSELKVLLNAISFIRYLWISVCVFEMCIHESKIDDDFFWARCFFPHIFVKSCGGVRASETNAPQSSCNESKLLMLNAEQYWDGV